MTRHTDTKTLIALAAAFAAGVLTLVPAAEAGNGVRLSFGGPLGSFVARPTQGYATPSYGAPKCDKPSYRTASRSHGSTHSAKKPVSVASRSRDDDDKPAKQAKKSRDGDDNEARSAKAETRSSDIKQIATNAVPLAAKSSTTTGVQTVAASQPAASVPPPLKLDGTAAPAAAPAAGNGAVAVGTASDLPVQSAALVPAPSTAETKAPTEVKASTEVKAEVKTEKRVDKKKDGDCRRFIPAAGITISVRCND